MRDIQHSMSTVIDTRFHIWFILRLFYKMWQKFITNYGCYFITKCDKSLLQNASGFLLQNATVLVQNVTVITNCDNFITKCDSYYKMRRLLQIATVYCKKIHSYVIIYLFKISAIFLQNWNISSSDTLKPKIYLLLTFPCLKC